MKTTSQSAKQNNFLGEKLEMQLCHSLYDIKCFLLDYQEKLDELHSTKKESAVYSAKLLANIIRDENERHQQKRNIMTTINAMYKKVGINSRLEGARFLTYCIFYSCANPEYGIMKIYKIVAKKFGTNPERVGRACRYACRTADLARLPETPYYDKGILLDFNETAPTAKQVVYAFAMLINDKYDFRKII